MIVLDASAMVKLVVEETGSKVAREIYKNELSDGERIIVPNIALPETLNTIWKYHALKKQLNSREYEECVNDAISIFMKLEKMPDEEIAKYSSIIASRYKIPVYDSLYTATSMLNNAPLLTFDAPIARKAKEIGLLLVELG